MKTRAVREGDHFILNGSKAFITNAGVGGVAVVMAVTDPARRQKGISAFILDEGLPGFSAGRPYRKLGLHASNTAELILDNVRVPAGQLCGELHMGFVNTMQVLEGGRVAMAAMAVGIAQGALDEALKYMKQRSAFGRTLAEFNGLQGMIADIGTEVEAARLLTLRAAALKDARPAREGGGLHGQGLRLRGGDEGGDQVAADPRRRRLHHGVPHRAHLPRRQAHRDRRGHLGGPAHGHRARDPRIPVEGAWDRASVLYEVKDGVGTITLNRPRVLNALDTDLAASLADAAERAARDPDVWVVVVRGRPGVLSGMDRTALSARDRRGVLPPLDPRLNCLEDMDKLVVACSTATASAAGSSSPSRATCGSHRRRHPGLGHRHG